MRAIAIALVLLALIAGSADATDDDDELDEDGAFAGFRAWSIALTLGGHDTRVEGMSASGWGPTLELAIGRYRWQYFIEGGVATAGMNERTDGALEARVGGRMIRGGVGARWLARQFQVGSNGGIELYLVSVVGAQRHDVGELSVSRGEVALGFGLQARVYKRPQLALRFDARAQNHGFMGGMGIAW